MAFMKAPGIDASSLERIVPDELQSQETTGAETLRLHLERYRFAKQNLVAGRLLDVACGVGYGTALLSENPIVIRALGVDISPEAVEYADRRYRNQRVSFINSDALTFSPGHQFENIVSLETVEHVDDPHALFGHLVSLLAPGGRLIASVPVTPSVDGNPHHKTNFSRKSFQRLGDVFALVSLKSLSQVQPYRPLAIVTRREARSADLRQNLGLFYFHNPAHFFLRIWSTLRDGFVNKYLTVVWEKPK